MPETLTPQLRDLTQSILKFHDLFSNDADLVREGAAAHHITVTSGNLLMPIEPGQYSARVPEGTVEELNALANAQTLTVECMDYRQVHETMQAVTDNQEGHVILAMAGGAAQPREDRRVALVDFVKRVRGVNPDVKINLVVHDQVCGGANHFTGGEMKRVFTEEGAGVETDRMAGMLRTFASELFSAGVSDKGVSGYLSHVDNNQFAELRQVALK